jgi:adenylate kinase
MKLIITGPPGAGKGTMARFIHEEHNIPIISTGEILRQEIKSGTDLGNAAKELIEKGDLVPDDMVVSIIRDFTKDMHSGYLLDGFPRNLAQAIEFDKMLKEDSNKIDVVINIDVEDEVIIDRVKGRLICTKCGRSFHSEYAKPKEENLCDYCNEKLEKRKDDSEESIRYRLEVYRKETKPLIDYFARVGILVNVECTVDNITETRDKLKHVLENKINKAN